jgi:hypothetical protein
MFIFGPFYADSGPQVPGCGPQTPGCGSIHILGCPNQYILGFLRFLKYVRSPKLIKSLKNWEKSQKCWFRAFRPDVPVEELSVGQI